MLNFTNTEQVLIELFLAHEGLEVMLQLEALLWVQVYNERVK